MQSLVASRFVNRADEIQFIIQRLNNLKQHVAVKECVVNFYGAPGIGKTALLTALRDHLRHDTTVITIELDLSQLIGINDNVAKQQVAQSLAHVVSLPNGADTTSIAPPRAGKIDTSQMVDVSVGISISHLTSIGKPLVLLIDNWHYVSDTLLVWIERKILLPLVRYNCMIGVLTSQTALRWRQFEIRRRVKQYSLATLNRDATQQQLASTSELSNTVFAITAGHPLANTIAQQHLTEHNWSGEWLVQHKATIAHQVVETLQDQIIQQLTPDIKNAFLILSLFREFDINTLRVILPHFIDTFRHATQATLLTFIKQMLETKIVKWNDTSRSYQIDPTIRSIFANALRLNHQNKYTTIRTMAIDYYARLIIEVPGSRDIYLLEYYYHLLQQDGAFYVEEDIYSLFKRQLSQYYVSPNGYYLDTTGLENLRTMLQNDYELCNALDHHQLSRTLLLDILAELGESIPPHAVQ